MVCLQEQRILLDKAKKYVGDDSCDWWNDFFAEHECILDRINNDHKD